MLSPTPPQKRVNLKVYKETSQEVLKLRKELDLKSPADVFHLLIEAYPEPEQQLERSLVTKEIYEADQQKLTRLKNAFKCNAYADLMDELLRYYQANSVELAVEPKVSVKQKDVGEKLFTNILNYLERKRKANRKARTKKE